MVNVEKELQCTGWCNVTYFNSDINQPTAMAKYLFTDVNRGPPARLGCLDAMVTWLIPLLMAFGAVALLLAGFQLIVFILTLCQCYARDRDHQHQVPHDDRKHHSPIKEVVAREVHEVHVIDKK